MAPETFVVLSGVLTFGVPIAFGLWELRALRRPPRRGGSGPGRQPDPEPDPKPLPDCLIPRRLPGRVRQLEDA